jgi:hypothetical protein
LHTFTNCTSRPTNQNLQKSAIFAVTLSSSEMLFKMTNLFNSLLFQLTQEISQDYIINQSMEIVRVERIYEEE